MTANMKRLLEFAILISAMMAVAANFANAQVQSQQKENVISGHITSSDSQPVTNARVSVNRFGGNNPSQSVRVDSSGTFQIGPLDPGLYSVSVIVPGLIRDQTSPAVSPYSRPGDSVDVKMIKGGVITGTVKNANGDPLIAILVRAFRVKGLNGEAVPYSVSSREGRTDDRGVYRIYGLPAGTYVVSAGGQGRAFGFGVPAAYDGFVPTYAPSATRDTATEIQVTNGNEAPADIQFREERGHVISGAIIGPATSEGGQQWGAVVNVFDVRNRVEVASVSVSSGSNYSFAVYGVPDGDYEIYANQTSNTGDQMASPAARIKVQGADVTGVRLTVAPLALLEGRVAFESDPKTSCGKQRANALVETAMSARRYEPRGESKNALPSDVPTSAQIFFRWAFVGANGAFSFKGLAPGTYLIDSTAPASGWYLRSVTLGRTAAPTMVRDGVPLKRGDHFTALNVTFAEGAAKLKGHLSAGEGQPLPLKLRVYLVPEDREAATNVYRYYEAAAERDGTFTIDNVAPGRYLMLARRPEENETGTTKLLRLDETLRTAVLKEAEAQKKAIAFKPCEQVSDFDLPYVSAPR